MEKLCFIYPLLIIKDCQADSFDVTYAVAKPMWWWLLPVWINEVFISKVPGNAIRQSAINHWLIWSDSSTGYLFSYDQKWLFRYHEAIQFLPEVVKKYRIKNESVSIKAEHCKRRI